VLFERWGVVIPLGEYPGIGMGGHVAGGAFGFLCRQLPFPDLFAAPPGGVSTKVKDALLRKRFTDLQIGVAY